MDVRTYCQDIEFSDVSPSFILKTPLHLNEGRLRERLVFVREESCACNDGPQCCEILY